MSVRRIIALKRSALQSQIDSLAAREAQLTRRIEALRRQDDGLDKVVGGAAFQYAAQSLDAARSTLFRLEKDRETVRAETQTLARERLALDVADAKLEAAELADRRLEQSRAEDRA